MKITSLLKLCLVSAGLLVGIQAIASPVLLTMDEVPSQLLDGLTVSKGGLSFTFTDDSQILFYNSNGPGNRTYVNDPSIQGFSINPFSIAFSSAVHSIQFGLAENTNIPLQAQVTLFNGANVVATLPFSLSLVDPFTEGQFNWSGAAVTSMTVTPDSRSNAIAFDNLLVDTAEVPEPGSLALLGAGLAGLALRRRRSDAII